MSLASIPRELVLSISAFLPEIDRQCLRSTCRGFRALIFPPPLVKHWATMPDIKTATLSSRIPGCCVGHLTAPEECKPRPGETRWRSSDQQKAFLRRLLKDMNGVKGPEPKRFLCTNCWRIKSNAEAFTTQNRSGDRNVLGGITLLGIELCKRCAGKLNGHRFSGRGTDWGKIISFYN